MNTLKLKAKSVKVTLIVDPTDLVGASVPAGESKAPVAIETDGRTIRADLNAKSLRKALETLRSEGPTGVAIVLQGRLDGNNVLLDAGIAAQPRKQQAAAMG
jgi:hypothetical protein